METIDTYFKTGNEYWNDTVFSIYNKAIKSGLFADAETPVKMFADGVDFIFKNRETPIKAVTEFLKEMEGVEKPQQLFVLKEIASYFNYTEFDGVEMDEVPKLLNSHISRLKPEKQDLRETLKGIVMDELETLSETIKELEPDKRLSIVCKLMPFVLPRVNSVRFDTGEHNDWNL